MRIRAIITYEFDVNRGNTLDTMDQLGLVVGVTPPDQVVADLDLDLESCEIDSRYMWVAP